MKLLLIACGIAVSAFAAETVEIPVNNDQVRVLKVVVQPHEKTRLHQHKVNRVMIYLEPGTQDFDYQGKKSTLNWKAGEVKWSPAAGMHIAEITSEKPVTIVEVELKKPGGQTKHEDELDPVKVDARHYRVEFENEQVRVLRVHIGPHEGTPMHSHPLNRAVVYLTGEKVRTTTLDGKVTEGEHKAGEVSWAGPAKHSEENLSDGPMDVVAVELKN